MNRGDDEPDWGDMAQLPDLRSVLDPGDAVGTKNQLIDKIHRESVLSVLRRKPGTTIVDLGCGIGRTTQWIARETVRVVGVDANSAMLAEARRRKTDALLARADLEHLPFASASIDAVTSVYVLQYAAPEWSRLVSIARELSRILRPRGQGVFVEIVSETPVHCGAPAGDYVSAFEEAGFIVRSTRQIRSSASPIVERASRHPFVSRLPLLPSLVRREARRRDSAARPTEYADGLFVIERR